MRGTRFQSWLRHCTGREVAGSIPHEVIRVSLWLILLAERCPWGRLRL